jgi:L-rhamnose isomerase/sugar isomerase
MLAEWRRAKGVPEQPLKAFRGSGYVARVTKERGERNMGAVSTYA